MTRSLFATLLLLGSTVAPSSAGVIRGVLHVPNGTFPAVAVANPYPGSAGSLPGVHCTGKTEASDAVVYVDRVPAAAESALARAPAEVPKLSQLNQSFVPRVLAVSVGSAVDFPNMDPIYHNVFSLSPPRRFDLGKYPRGKSKRVVFDKPGLVNVFCDIHSDMAAFVLVLAHHGFARPRSSGEFRLPDLPAGRYQLKAWHPDYGEITQSVQVPARGEVVVDLTY